MSLGTAHAAAAPLAPAEIRAGHCDDLDAESLVQALEAELPKLLLRPPSAAPTGAPVPAAAPPVRFGRVRMRLAEYARSTLEPLLALARQGRSALCAALPREFTLQRLASAERGHFSAYFHPLVRGSRTRHGPYQFALYRRPPEPQSQLTTAEILSGRLDHQDLELAYLDSLGTALNVHIEGSATVQFDDGSEVNLTTDGNNGHPYTNPFKLAREDGIITAAAVESPPDAAAAAQPRRSRTRLFFDQHPDLLRDYWAKNPHFVFFKPTPLRGTGKFGQLVAGRSVAVDATRVPLGAALWMRTELASAAAAGSGSPASYTKLARLALAQDTGAAIRGIGRVDIFVGSGPKAQHAAAFTSRPGELYLIVRKSPGHAPGPPRPPKRPRKHRHVVATATRLPPASPDLPAPPDSPAAVERQGLPE